MADADVVISGTALTVDDARPTAEALAVAGRRIIAVGTRSDVAGKYADMGVLSADARTVPPEQIADLDSCAAYLAGRQVYPQ
jgi:predicted amidohydrolase YtcJ